MTKPRFLAQCDCIVRYLAILGGYGFLILSLLIAFEVVARKLFNFSLQGVDEIGGYIMAAAVALGLSYALAQRAHTRIDMFVEQLPGRLPAAMHVLAQVSLAGFALFMAWRAAVTLNDSIGYQSVASTPLQTPLWIPQLAWNVGLFFFAFLATATAVHALILFFRQPDTVAAHYGSRTVRDELDDELEAIGARPQVGGGSSRD